MTRLYSDSGAEVLTCEVIMKATISAERQPRSRCGDRFVTAGLPPSPRRPAANEAHGTTAGFTLVEALVVLVLLGLLAAIALTTMSSSWQKSRLQSSADQVKAFVQGAYDETARIHAPVFVRFTPEAGGGGTLQLARDAAGSQVLDTFDVPSYISFSTASVGEAQGNWPAADGSSLAASSTAARVLECDLIGRTLSPTGTQVSAAQQIVMTHRRMVTGSLTPPMRYLLNLSPLWHVQVNREMY